MEYHSVKQLTLAAALLCSLAISGCAELKEAGRQIGSTTKEVTTDIGHASRDAVKSVKQDLSED
ncbi:hypothetical protein TUM4438_28930 [Shewanella sairae]|uniref:Entericidin A/B family lipoprotein n=1 Tax=Shewanella sairae TaxID=190310 RepID=A0ABQ4PK16_9GAMM|nr:hypothetical protein [Shewanella sairae]GIU48162.1 hypothetical protein TUM4438_28930 [Shewanella sairae]